MARKLRAYDLFGNVALVNFPKGTKPTQKKWFASELMKKQPSVKTVLEKIGKVKGRLRKLTTKHVAGVKTKEVLYKENGCYFRFNIDKTYFSPRLGNERKEIASKIKKREKVLVMFAGVGSYPIVIAKNSKTEKVVSVEINMEASKYAKFNVELNKLKNKVEIVQGDVKKLKLNEKFDVIVMPRPKLKETFLKEAFSFSRKGTRIFYYGFCKTGEENKIVEQINSEAKKYKNKIKILGKKIAGEIAPYKVRLRADFRIL